MQSEHRSKIRDVSGDASCHLGHSTLTAGELLDGESETYYKDSRRPRITVKLGHWNSLITGWSIRSCKLGVLDFLLNPSTHGIHQQYVKCMYTYILYIHTYVCTCMPASMHVCMHVCIPLCTCLHVYRNITVSKCLYMHTRTHTHTYTYIYMYVCMPMRVIMYVCMYIYICVWVCAHRYVSGDVML